MPNANAQGIIDVGLFSLFLYDFLQNEHYHHHTMHQSTQSFIIGLCERNRLVLHLCVVFTLLLYIPISLCIVISNEPR